VQAGVTQPIKSETIDKIVPAQYRDPTATGRNLDARPRDLRLEGSRQAGRHQLRGTRRPKWKGKICIRSGQHIYNNGLFAAYAAKYGEAKAENGCAASRPIWRKNPPAATAKPRATSRPANATSASATPITGR